MYTNLLNKFHETAVIWSPNVRRYCFLWWMQPCTMCWHLVRCTLVRPHLLSGWLIDLQHLLTAQKRKEDKRVTESWGVVVVVIVVVVGGSWRYDRLPNSPQDTSHTSLVGSGKENGGYVCCGCPVSHKHTRTRTHTLLPQLPLSCPLSWQVELCWQAPH